MKFWKISCDYVFEYIFNELFKHKLFDGIKGRGYIYVLNFEFYLFIVDSHKIITHSIKLLNLMEVFANPKKIDRGEIVLLFWNINCIVIIRKTAK